MAALTIARRFNGPPRSGNGGYVCGLFAGSVGAEVRVRLHSPPPLERPLEVVADEPGGNWSLRDGDDVIATARAERLQLDVPLPPPPYVQAASAAQHFTGFHEHVFPDCFVCGPNRRSGDGLRIFPGRLESGVVAAPWVPDPSLAGGDGTVATEFLWAALDCPGYFAIASGTRVLLLGDMQARVERCVRAGEPCTVIAWPIGAEGRRHFAGSALFDGEGELCAKARATWVEPRTAG